MEGPVRSSTSQFGFSLIEVVVTLAVLMVAASVAVMNMGSAVHSSHIETAYQTTIDQLRFARQTAIDKRTVCRVDFAAPGRISVTQAFADGTPQQAETLSLPQDVAYVVVPGMPSPPDSPPDNIGNGKIAIDFDQIGGGSGTTLYFQPDGSALDAAGRVNDGVVYVARPNELSDARAISVLGTTGRIRGWRLVSRSGGGATWQ